MGLSKAEENRAAFGLDDGNGVSEGNLIEADALSAASWTINDTDAEDSPTAEVEAEDASPS